jgi:formate dehydrogenase beta subunit
MSQATLAIRRISGHAGPAPGEDVERDYQVCKLIDTTTCIGCKACEVACLEWNGYTFTDTVFDNSYQTMPETAWNYWNLIKFNEHEREDGSITLLMRKDQCMHCADPGCLAACPADGAIVQYTNGIVDFQQQNCIGCGYCVSGCPFDIPKFNPTTKKMFKCTLCVDRVSEGWSRPASSPAPPDVSTSAARTTWWILPRLAPSSFVTTMASRRPASMIRQAWAEPASSMCCTM